MEILNKKRMSHQYIYICLSLYLVVSKCIRLQTVYIPLIRFNFFPEVEIFRLNISRGENKKNDHHTMGLGERRKLIKRRKRTERQIEREKKIDRKIVEYNYLQCVTNMSLSKN